MNRLKKITALMSALAVTAALISGCEYVDIIKSALTGEQPESENETVTTDENGIAASNSISVGIIDFDTLNPLTTQSETVRECMQLVYEPLFDVDEKLRPVPVLAESYTVSPDGRTIDITTRSDVLWQDGSSFNAYDVAYTIKQVRAGLTTYTDNLANMADYRALDTNLLRIVLNYAVPDFVSLMNFPIVKYQSDISVNPNFVPVGTGAFRFTAQLSGGKLQFDAFDGDHNGRPLVDTLYVYTLPNLEKYESMFEASEIDLITGNTIDLTQYAPRGSATNTEYVTNKMTFAGFNTRSALLSGRETRKGISKLIDKDNIVNSVIYSRGVAADVPINPSSLFYYDTNTKFKRDELLALSYLGNDGWGISEDGDYVRTVNGRRQRLAIKILTDSGSAEKTAVAEKIAKDMTEFAIPSEVEALPYEEYAAKVAAGSYDVMIGEIEIAPNLDPTPLISSSGNYFGYYNPNLDTLVGEMGVTHDEEQLMELMKQYGDTVLYDMPFSVLYFRKGDVLSSSKIKTQLVPSVTRKYRNAEGWSVR